MTRRLSVPSFLFGAVVALFVYSCSIGKPDALWSRVRSLVARGDAYWRTHASRPPSIPHDADDPARTGGVFVGR